MASPFAALLFDMDGLLFDTERAFMDALTQVAAPHGISKPQAEDFFLSIVGTSATATGTALRAFLPDHVDAVAFEKDWRATCRVVLDQGIPFRPGAEHVLPRLRGLGYRLALVTSSRRAAVDHHLGMTGFADMFDVIVAGEDVSAHKPDPAPYLMAASELGVDPRRCAAFEDSDLGTAAAIAAGCVTTQIPDLRPVGLPLPDLGQFMAPTLTEAVEGLGVLAPTLA